MSGAWRLAAKNLRRNRRRNLATGLAITLGFAGLVLLHAYVQRIDVFLTEAAVYLQHTGHVAVWREGGLEQAAARPLKFSLGPAEQRRIGEALAGEARVDFTGRYLRGMGLAGNGCRSVPFVALGIESAALGQLAGVRTSSEALTEIARPVAGRSLAASGDVPDAVVVSTGLARRLGKTHVHDDLPPGAAGAAVPDCSAPGLAARLAADANVQLAGMTWDGSLTAIDGELTGVIRTASIDTEDQTLLARLDTLQSLYATDAVTYVAVFLHDARDARSFAKELEGRLRAAGLPVRVYWYGEEEYNPYYAGSMAFMNSMVGFITVLVSAVVALGVLNAMTLTVLERTRELGTFRALGWRRGPLAGLFLRESALLAGGGILLGGALAFAISAGVYAADIHFSPPGIPGTVRLIVTPRAATLVRFALLFVPLTALATHLAVRASVRRAPADLLTSTTG